MATIFATPSIGDNIRDAVARRKQKFQLFASVWRSSPGRIERIDNPASDEGVFILFEGDTSHKAPTKARVTDKMSKQQQQQQQQPQAARVATTEEALQYLDKSKVDALTLPADVVQEIEQVLTSLGFMKSSKSVPATRQDSKTTKK